MSPKIIHVQALDRGVILHLDRMALEEEVVPLVFPPSRFPEGIPAGASLSQWRDRYDKWHLILTRAPAARLHPELYEAIVLASPYTPGEVQRQEEADEKRRREAEQWWDTYHPILGMAPSQAVPGWYERKGHFIWIGDDPHDFHASFQIEPVSKVKSFNRDVRYYLERGLSLYDAYRKIKSDDFDSLKASALALGGFPEFGLAMLQEQASAEEARMERLIEQELNADRGALETGIAEGLARLGR